MTRWFVDSSVLLTAFGDPHEHRDDCRRFVKIKTQRADRIHLSVETLHEVLFHRMRRGSREHAVAVARDLAGACVLHDFDTEVLDRSIELVATTPIRGRDAVIAATALLGGFDSIVTLDAHFDAVPGLRPIGPAEALA